MMEKIAAWLVALCLFQHASVVLSADHYVRYETKGKVRYGVLRGGEVMELQAGLFPMSGMTGGSVALDDIRLLPPTEAGKVFAVGMNFASHLSSSSRKPPPVFVKLPSSLTAHGATIVLPADARNVHFEGELVLVIGKVARNVSQDKASDYIFGVTVGNDLTERSWQRRDLQWIRAKASDGFGPVGPSIATGLDYTNLLLTTRLNNNVVQQENTRHMIHSPAKVVSYLSEYFTLEPGDLIFMGTPGRTQAMKHGDVVSVEIEGVGLLSNTIESSNEH